MLLQLISELPSVFRTILKKYNLAAGDFPDISDYQSKLREMEFSKFSSLKQKLIDDTESVLTNDIPRLMEALPRSLNRMYNSVDEDSAIAKPAIVYPTVRETSPPPPAGVSSGYRPADEANPWGNDEDLPTPPQRDWMLAPYVASYESRFQAGQVGGFMTGKTAKDALTGTGVSVGHLRKIWDLADIDRDGKLNLNEFVVAMYLSDMVRQGHEVPSVLDPAMVPP